MKISYITNYDASDIHNWSGLGYYISRSLINQNATVDFVNTQHSNSSHLIKIRRLVSKLLGSDFDTFRDPSIIRKTSAKTNELIKPDTDIIFSPSSIPISLLETNKPKVFYTDATYAGMLGFYKDYSKLSKAVIKKGNYLEQKALDSASLAIFSSEWAAESAIKHYHVNPSKVKVVPFGANIDFERSPGEIEKIISNRSSKICNLLFVGVDWDRKGGDLAVKVTEQLNEMGLKTYLHIVGIKQLPINNCEYIINHGFISKATKAGNQEIEKLFEDSHFLILPTKADCTPIVFSEANSFALPVLTTNVGGIPSIIKNDVNGKAFILGAVPAEWSSFIYKNFNDRKQYYKFCHSSFNEYQERLNWQKTGEALINLMKEI